MGNILRNGRKLRCLSRTSHDFDRRMRLAGPFEQTGKRPVDRRISGAHVIAVNFGRVATFFRRAACWSSASRGDTCDGAFTVSVESQMHYPNIIHSSIVSCVDFSRDSKPVGSQHLKMLYSRSHANIHFVSNGKAVGLVLLYLYVCFSLLAAF